MTKETKQRDEKKQSETDEQSETASILWQKVKTCKFALILAPSISLQLGYNLIYVTTENKVKRIK